VENLILTATGSVVGTVLAIGLNMAVARYYEVARIEAPFLAIGVLTVLLLGQAAAYVPARRAAKEAPVAILRSA
jgi:putative ABC transport system permease protein